MSKKKKKQAAKRFPTYEDDKGSDSLPTELEEATQELEDAKGVEVKAKQAVEDKAAEVERKTPPPCPRCKGDGTWHSTKTGIRAKTASEPLQDSSRTCPECDGK